MSISTRCPGCSRAFLAASASTRNSGGGGATPARHTRVIQTEERFALKETLGHAVKLAMEISIGGAAW